MADLISNCMKVGFPRRQKCMEVRPMLCGEGSMHGRGDMNHLVRLIDFGSDQFGFQKFNEKILHLIVPKLQVLLNFAEADLVSSFCQLHECKKFHLF